MPGESFNTSTLMQGDTGWQCMAFCVEEPLGWWTVIEVFSPQQGDGQGVSATSGDTSPVWAQCSIAIPALVQTMTNERMRVVSMPVILFIGTKVVVKPETAKYIPLFSVFQRVYYVF